MSFFDIVGRRQRRRPQQQRVHVLGYSIAICVLAFIIGILTPGDDAFQPLLPSTNSRGAAVVGRFDTISSYVIPLGSTTSNDHDDSISGDTGEDDKTKKKNNKLWTSAKGGTTNSQPSYSDNFLFQFHTQAQDEKQLLTNSLTKWNEELQRDYDEIIEWRDSFDRNGLADFTPPMTQGLNCLMAGGDGVDVRRASSRRKSSAVVPVNDVVGGEIGNGVEPNLLPWEDEAGADITSIRVLTSSVPSSSPDSSGSSLVSVDNEEDHYEDDTPFPLVRTERIPSVAVPGGVDGRGTSSSSSVPMASDPERRASVYDCIVDQGLMDAVLALSAGGSNKADMERAIRDLVFEAATAIREHGIYVVVTRCLSKETQRLLEDCSVEAGLEWQFTLDGISDDTRVVSVARRFCTGAMPKVGKLSRFQP